MPCATIELQREYQKRWLANRRANAIQKFGGKCVKCGGVDNLEFDHIDRSKKEFHISHIWSYKIDHIYKELSKCQLLCSNCHKEKTAKERCAHLSHGTNGMYNKGCRCRQCTDAKIQTIYEWRKKVGGRKAIKAGNLGGNPVP